jgi:hypothetical protein
MRFRRIVTLTGSSSPRWTASGRSAHVRGHHCTLISRNGHTFKSWPQLAEETAHSARAHSAILDGGICCLDPDGTSNFKDVLLRREWPFFVGLDVLPVDGEDIRSLPLLTRKTVLRRIMPRVESRLRYLNDIEGGSRSPSPTPRRSPAGGPTCHPRFPESTSLFAGDGASGPARSGRW